MIGTLALDSNDCYIRSGEQGPATIALDSNDCYTRSGE